jgi:acetoin utilization deacetylase AcuC-like enzyme
MSHGSLRAALLAAGGRVCSLLEGGYEVRSALAESVAAHVEAMLE